MPARVSRSLLHLQTDARLARLTAAGDDQAFAALVGRHRTALQRHCERVLAPERAQDAVQQAFINAHRALVRGDEVDEVRAWLHRIAHNAALGILRERGRDDAPLEHGDGAATEGVEDVLDRRERLEAVLGALAELPDRQRQALALQALEGRSHEEIAAELGTSDGAVRQLLARGRSALRVCVTGLIPFGLALRLGTRDAQAAVGAGSGAASAGTGALVLKGLAVATLAAGVAGVGTAALGPRHHHGSKRPPVAVVASRRLMPPAAMNPSAAPIAPGALGSHAHHAGPMRHGARWQRSAPAGAPGSTAPAVRAAPSHPAAPAGGTASPPAPSSSQGATPTSAPPPASAPASPANDPPAAPAPTTDTSSDTSGTSDGGGALTGDPSSSSTTTSDTSGSDGGSSGSDSGSGSGSSSGGDLSGDLSSGDTNP